MATRPIAIGPIFDGSSAASSGAEARQFGFKVGGQGIDSFRQSGCRRQASDERAIGGEEGRREGCGGHIQPFGPVEGVEAFLPRHAVGVERTAKVEKHRFDRLCHPYAPVGRAG